MSQNISQVCRESRFNADLGMYCDFDISYGPNATPVFVEQVGEPYTKCEVCGRRNPKYSSDLCGDCAPKSPRRFSAGGPYDQKSLDGDA